MRAPLLVMALLLAPAPMLLAQDLEQDQDQDDPPFFVANPVVDPETVVVADEDFVLRPGDRVSVSVLEDSNLNRTLLVRPDGKISMPIAGAVDAAGRTPEELQRIILRALSTDFVTAPTVDVSLAGLGPFNSQIVQRLLQQELQGAQFFVIGEIARSGGFEFEPAVDFTVLKALALAGGPSEFAATERIQIRRTGQDGEIAIYLFDYEAVLDGEPLADPVPILDGDVIVVPERGLFE